MGKIVKLKYRTREMATEPRYRAKDLCLIFEDS